MRRASGDALTLPGAGWAREGRRGDGFRSIAGPASPLDVWLLAAPAADEAGGSRPADSVLGWVGSPGRLLAAGCAALAPLSPCPAAPASSPGCPITATGSETGTVAPASTMCLSSVPAARATSSITALSVSTSASTSPTATGSPSCFFHSTRRPSSMVGERASMTTFVGMRVRLKCRVVSRRSPDAALVEYVRRLATCGS